MKVSLYLSLIYCYCGISLWVYKSKTFLLPGLLVLILTILLSSNLKLVRLLVICVQYMNLKYDIIRRIKGAVSREILPFLTKRKLQYLYLFTKQY